MSTDIILQTHDLTKRYGHILAVDRLNVSLRRGEVYGFLGPNGSGKSTTVAMILGLVRPTAGEVEVFGMPLLRNRWSILRRVGAIIESPAFYPYLSGRDNLKVIARALGEIGPKQIDAVLDRVDLAGRANDKYETYSLGMKQRLGIASTLLRDPQLVILDEPTNGLDPAGTREVRDLIPQLADEGRSVLMSSHLLHEVEQVCDRVTILQRGRQLTETTVGNLVGQDRGLRLKLHDERAREAAASILRGVPWIRDVRYEDGYIVASAPAERSAEINRLLGEEGVWVAELAPIHATLESVFLELTGEGDGAGDA